MASHLLWQPTNGLGTGGPPADGWAGRSHGRGLAPGEPAGRPPALPIPGLAGLRSRPQLLRVAGQPKLARGPAARRMKVHRPPRTPAAADQMLPGVAAHVLLWPPSLRGLSGLGPGGHHRLQRCPRPSLYARNGVLCFVLCFLLRSKCALGTREARSQIKFVTSWPWLFHLVGGLLALGREECLPHCQMWSALHQCFSGPSQDPLRGGVAFLEQSSSGLAWSPHPGSAV
ncbi:translocator protein isoform X1 [Mustela erminea]|uniref:translocator protein isoform X1 n=1 Tax=Mustela erminea TaxID=36723 RepID=UPI00138676DE|nr:translocator protein isoform X1 [Mustela erminea]